MAKKRKADLAANLATLADRIQGDANMWENGRITKDRLHDEMWEWRRAGITEIKPFAVELAEAMLEASQEIQRLRTIACEQKGAT